MDNINLLLTISYCGTNFSGWQVQPNKRTVQGEIERALKKLFNSECDVVGSGRTDAGVHALNAKANVLLPKEFTIKNFYNAETKFDKLLLVLNCYLPQDVRILKIKQVSAKFNARKSAKKKTYLYKIQNSGIASPFDYDRVYFFNKELDVDKMQQASNHLIGEHDFSSFCSSNTSVNSFVRTIYDIKIYKKSNIINFEITGNGFLYNMVRIIVGTLIDVGTNKIPPEKIKFILEEKDRKLAGKTAPSLALYLKNVKY